MIVLQAGVRAMDVMNVFSKKKAPGTDLTRFAVSGGSKVCVPKCQ